MMTGIRRRFGLVSAASAPVLVVCRLPWCVSSPVRRSMELFDDAEGPIWRNPGCSVVHPSLDQGVLSRNH